MNEALLQYIWEYKLFDPAGLITSEGDRLTVIYPGRKNTNAGPDFLEARIRIHKTLWVGNIELHVHTSDWDKHRHDNNEQYANIILHVVYFNDVTAKPGVNFPLLELKNAIKKDVLARYEMLMMVPDMIPCTGQLQKVPDIVWLSWLDRLVAERWEEKLADWQQLLAREANDWRTLLYYRLAANFGFHVNRDAFLELARSLPLKILVRHKNSLLQIEALLFGQSGLLPHKNQDAYTASLEQEYHFLRRKYQLDPMPAHRWKFMRLRPANFPTMRIAQFAILVFKSLELFAKMMEVRSAEELIPLLNVTAGKYWQMHYRFGEKTKDKISGSLGKDAAINIMINTVAPMQYLYAKLEGRPALIYNSLDLLRSLKSENNNIIRAWKKYGIEAEDAAMSQALLQLYNNYCTVKGCLHCAIGNALLKP